MCYVVQSQANDRYDGWVILRKGKGKERGYEAGKEPKGGPPKNGGETARPATRPPGYARLSAARPAPPAFLP